MASSSKTKVNKEAWRNRIIGSGEERPDQLLANPSNFRIHPQGQQDALAGVLDEVGWVQEVIVNKVTNTLIDGHLRVSLALRRGEQSIPVKYVELSEAEEKLILATFDPISAMAATDAAKLDELLKEVSTGDAAVQQMLSELAEGAGLYLDKKEGKGGDEFDTTPPKEATRVKYGDLWELGKHRLLCGDSTDGVTVERLMQGEKAILCHADPPYGMGKENEGIANDNLYNEKLDAFQMQWLKVARQSLDDNSSVYIWGTAEDLWRLWFTLLIKVERVTFRNEIVWDKTSGQGMSSEQHRMYPTASERCLFYMLGEQGFNTNSDNYWEGWEPLRQYLLGERLKMGWDVPTMKRAVGHSDLLRDHWTSKSQWDFPTREVYLKLQEGAKNDAFKRDYDELKRDYDELKRDFYQLRAYFDNSHESMVDVWHFDRVKGKERHEHATPKPVAMIERIVKSSCPENGVVLEPFLGSGTTIIAAERTNRRCYGLEISPVYCEVILSRWEAETGQEAKLLDRVETKAAAEILCKVN